MQHVGEVELLDGHLPGLAERHVPQQDVRSEGQRVHVLCGRAVYLPGLDQRGTLRLRLTGRLAVPEVSREVS